MTMAMVTRRRIRNGIHKYDDIDNTIAEAGILYTSIDDTDDDDVQVHNR